MWSRTRYRPPLPLLYLLYPFEGSDRHTGAENVRLTAWEVVGSVLVHLSGLESRAEGDEPMTLGSVWNLQVVRVLEVILKTELVTSVDMHVSKLGL